MTDRDDGGLVLRPLARNGSPPGEVMAAHSRPSPDPATPRRSGVSGRGGDAGRRPDATEASRALVSRHLGRYAGLVREEIRRILAAKRFAGPLGSQLADYPLRGGKGLRPALCLATCEAFGGAPEDALPSAVALELFHNAFLVHDDVEDESLHRRGQPTMHEKHGTAIAVNVGDALNVLSMTPLLANLEVIGLERTLRVFREIERMARESVEGQSFELEWVKHSQWELDETDYYTMTRKKTCWYTCITPLRVGALIGGGPDVDLAPFIPFGDRLGVAFQIQDDLLNLVGEESRYGKETAGDLWEGKRTLMLIRLMRSASSRERRRVRQIMETPRREKTDADVRWVLDRMHAHGCIDHARDVSRTFAEEARADLDRCVGGLPRTSHRRFLEAIVDFVVHRDL